MTLQWASLCSWWLNTNQCYGIMSLKRATATRYQPSAVEKRHEPAEVSRDELETEGAAPPSNTNTTFPGNTNNPELCKRQFSLTTGWRTKTLHHCQDKTTMQHEFDSVQMLVLAEKKTSFASRINHQNCRRLSVIEVDYIPVLPADLGQMSLCCFNNNNLKNYS